MFDSCGVLKEGSIMCSEDGSYGEYFCGYYMLDVMNQTLCIICNISSS